MNTAVFSRVRSSARRARFDGRAVLSGIVVLAAATVLGFVLLGQATNKADEVAAPVADVCRQGGAAATELDARGACQAAGNIEAGTGPFVSEANPVVRGARGETGPQGAPGAPGQGLLGPAGQPGEGTEGQPGAQGESGQSPPCLSEPTQCRGADGRDGIDGQDGQDGVDGVDGQDGRDGSAAASQTYSLPDGRIFTCARTGGTDLDPLYRCQQSGIAAPNPSDDPTPTSAE